MRVYIVLLLTLLLATVAITSSTAANAQPDTTHTMWSVGAGYSSFKDDLAVGLLYQGFDMDGMYAERYVWEGAEVEWSILLSLNAMWSRGATAIDIYLKPWNGGALFTVVDDDWSLLIGPGLTGSYHTYLNPFVNSGHFFWYTHYDLELRLAAYFNIEAHRFRTQLNTAVVSLASRPVAMPDPYYYSWNLGDMITRGHSNMVLGSLDKVQHVDVAIEWFPPAWSNMSVSYVLSYDNYQPAPSLQTLQHLVRFTWY